MSTATELPYVVCLMPTYGRPELAANALACFLAQDYPADRRFLLIYDDGGQLDEAEGPGWKVISSTERCSSLPAKYNEMAGIATLGANPPPDIFLVWEHDDVYLPWHISAHVKALEGADWSHPEQVWSTYRGFPEKEGAKGRFHASLGFWAKYLRQVGGWVESQRANYDQQLISNLARAGTQGHPDRIAPPSYLFRWGSTNAPHGQHFMGGPESEGWWERCKDAFGDLAHYGELEPKLDEDTVRTIHKLIDLPEINGQADSLRTMLPVQDRPWESLRKEGLPFREIPPFTYIPAAAMMFDALTLAEYFPPDTTAIVGVARSGMIPAAAIATHLHLPLLSVSVHGSVQNLGTGYRLPDRVISAQERLIVVDDTACSGTTMPQAMKIVKKAFPGSSVASATVYSVPGYASSLDYVGAILPMPHWLEWNLANCSLTTSMAFDFDGVLCDEIPADMDDDGERYAIAIANTRPRILPRREPVPLIVTARLKKYEAQTRAWLAEHGVRVEELIMGPWHSLADRNRAGEVSAFKAAVYKQHPELELFVESCPTQAEEIARLSGKRTLCPSVGAVFTR